MKEMDDELQQWLENKPQLPAKNNLSDDAQAYQTLFEALGSEPENGLPYDFSAKVTRHIQAKAKHNDELKFSLIAAVIVLVVMAIACIAFTIESPNQSSIFLKYKWVLILLPVIFIAIQYFDQKLIRDKIFHNK